MAEMRSWQTLTSTEIGALDREDTVAVLPCGAVEQHGPHLPLGTDAMIAEGLLRHAGERLEGGITVVVLPTQAIGESLEHVGFPGTLSHDAETLLAAWTQIGASLASSGTRKLVILNAHGGQPQVVDLVAKRLRASHAMLVVRANYMSWPVPAELIDADEVARGIHGGELETALMLFFHPDLVRTDRLVDFPSPAAELAARHRRFGHGGRLGFSWQAQDLGPDGVVGNAARATAETGKALADHYAGILADLIADAAQFPLSQLKSRR